MRRASGAVVVALATLLVCCSAESRHQEGESDRYDGSGHKARNLGGGNLVRHVRQLPFPGYLASLPYTPSVFSQHGKSQLWPAASVHKKNFDEIDRSGLDTFVGKRNFDEIDQTSMPFPYATKRFYHLYGTNYLDYPVEPYRATFDKKRLRAEYPMDEIDLSHFPIGSKRAIDYIFRIPQQGGMDEIDATSLPIGPSPRRSPYSLRRAEEYSAGRR